MHTHDRNENYQLTKKNIKIAFILNFIFALAEIAGSLYTNSIAILADALHDLGDSTTLAFAWWMEKLSGKREDQQYTYGYRRLSLLSALVSAIILLGGSIFIVSKSVQRILNPEPILTRGMLIFSILGMLVNGYAAIRTKRGENLNSQMVFWHLFEDALGWMAVFVVSIIMIFRPIDVLDPILSIGISGMMIINVGRQMKKIFHVFLQGVPPSVNLEAIKKEILKDKKIRDMHHTHIWSLDGSQHVLTTHIVLHSGSNKDDIRRIKNLIRSLTGKYHLFHSTIEFEYFEEDCSMNMSHE